MVKKRKLINSLIGTFIGALILTFMPISALAVDPDTSDWPTECYCEDHPENYHFWFSGERFTISGGGQSAEGRYFNTDGTYEDITSQDYSAGTIELSLDYTRGWYYLGDLETWTPCSCNHSRITPASASTADMTSMHVHKFVKGTIYEATTNADGLEGIYCESCGFVMESSPISAFAFTLDKYAQQKIDAAKPGQTIVLEFGEFNSFPKSFMQKIAGKVNTGVSFEFRYKVNHQLTKIKIPAGVTVDTNLDWYGPATMEQLYGVFSK